MIRPDRSTFVSFFSSGLKDLFSKASNISSTNYGGPSSSTSGSSSAISACSSFSSSWPSSSFSSPSSCLISSFKVLIILMIYRMSVAFLNVSCIVSTSIFVV